jgi:hypothetical protein
VREPHREGRREIPTSAHRVGCRALSEAIVRKMKTRRRASGDRAIQEQRASFNHGAFGYNFKLIRDN